MQEGRVAGCTIAHATRRVGRSREPLGPRRRRIDCYIRDHVNPHSKHPVALAVLLAAALASPARAHLLVTEVGYDTVDETSPTAEFVEILNPGAGATSLADVWLVGDEDAYPYLVNGPVSPLTPSIMSMRSMKTARSLT